MSAVIEVKINPAVLIWARETANYEIEEISNKMDLSSERLTKWEKGEENPTYFQLLDLANHYQRPAMLFFSPKVPKSEPDSPPDFRTLPNQNIKISPSVTFELRTARARRENLILFEELDEYEFHKFNLKAQMGEDIQTLAENIKKSLDVSWAKQDSLKNYDKALEFYTERIENIGILIFQFYNIESEEMRGYALSYEKLPIIGINVKEHPHGKIFTLFHELIHIALRKEGISNINSFRLKDKVEIFCNKVAAEILVPKNQILEHGIVKRMDNGALNDTDLKKLSKRFKVSPEVIIRRLLSLNKISGSFFDSKQKKWNEFIASNYRSTSNSKSKDKEKPKAQEVTKEEPKIDPNVSKALKRNGFYYTELVLDAYENELINSSDLSEYLGEKLQTIDEIKKKLSQRGAEK